MALLRRGENGLMSKQQLSVGDVVKINIIFILCIAFVCFAFYQAYHLGYFEGHAECLLR